MTQENTIEKQDEEILEKFEEKILEQIENEYQYCWKIQKPKLDEWLKRLKVYNNQKKDKKKVGDPLLFTVFQTVFASLYDDKLSVKFLERETGDRDVAENLNLTAEFDYEEMKKEIIDYDWDWNTGFFGWGIVDMMEFNRKRKCPVPHAWSPLVTLKDPLAVSVNGDINGEGSARFFGREVLLTKNQMEKAKNYMNLEKLEEGSSTNSLTSEAEKEKRRAQGKEEKDLSEESGLGENAYYTILQWFTHIDGKKYLVESSNDRSVLVRYQELKEQNYWPVIQRKLFPIANEWDGLSIPDLVEDKQRARAVLINLGVETAKANANPSYLFDKNRIARRDVFDVEFNKYISVDQKEGDVAGAIAPIRKDTIKNEAQWILQLLDESTQRAMATPEIQQGQASSKQRTLGELELITSKVDTRYSLTAKVFGWSEVEFWRQWYSLYKVHFKKGIDEKIVRIAGIWGPEQRPLRRENIIANTDPDIKVESSILTRTKQINDRNLFAPFIQMISQIPDNNIRFAIKEMGKMMGFRTELIRQILPSTIDEINAEDENKKIENGEVPMVSVYDDDQTHLIIHAKTNDSEERKKHLQVHYAAMRIKKMNRKMLEMEGIGQETQGLVAPNIGGEEKREEKYITKKAQGSPTIIPGAYSRNG